MAEPKPVAAQPARKKVTIPALMEKMKKGEPIVQLAVYDYETAIVADRVGIDILCVSDTGGMVLFGHEDTTSVSFEEVMFMAQAVKRGSKYGLRMVDMPYMSFHLSPMQAVENAAKYVSQGGAEVMKMRGQPAPREEYRGDHQGRHPGAGPYRHHADAHASAGRVFRAGQDRRARQGAGRRRLGDGRRRLLLDHVRGDHLGGLRAPGRDAAGPRDFAGRGQPGARRAHHRLGSVPLVREAHAAALEDLRRPGADHREGTERLPRRRARPPLPRCRAHRVHEGRRAREVQTNCWKTEKNRLTRRASWARRAFFPA